MFLACIFVLKHRTVCTRKTGFPLIETKVREHFLIEYPPKTYHPHLSSTFGHSEVGLAIFSLLLTTTRSKKQISNFNRWK